MLDVILNPDIIVHIVYTAQVLQAIGNLAQEMDQKEDYMRCMTGFVQRNTDRLKQFVQQLVQVDQKEGKLVLNTDHKHIYPCLVYVKSSKTCL